MSGSSREKYQESTKYVVLTYLWLVDWRGRGTYSAFLLNCQGISRKLHTNLLKFCPVDLHRNTACFQEALKEKQKSQVKGLFSVICTQ